MIALLIVCATVVVILAIVAVGVANQEDATAEGLKTKIEEALAAATNRLEDAQDDALGAPVITARMSGLVEYVHGLTSVRDSDRRSSTPAFLFALAGTAIVAATTFAVVDRIEERRERSACVKVLANLQAAPTTTTATTASGSPTTTSTSVPTGATTTTAVPPTTAPPSDATPPPTSASPPTVPKAAPAPTPAAPPTLLPSPAVIEFLGACTKPVAPTSSPTTSQGPAVPTPSRP